MTEHPVLTRVAEAGVRLGLDRVELLLEHLGAPQRGLRVVHVAGSNGKGSVCAMVERCLIEGGHRVGATISPHLQQVNERIRVDGEPIADAAFEALLDQIDARASAWAVGAGLPDVQPLTYFELITVCALVHFQRVGVDIALVEVGLGGRLDATNVVEPTITAVTSIALEHTDRLGTDLASIAGEKAGIIKRGAPVVIGNMPRVATTVVRSAAMDRGARPLVYGEDYRVSGEPSSFRYEGSGPSREDLRIELYGQHQVENAGVAIMVLDALGEAVPELVIDEDALRRGLCGARHPGRLEWLHPKLLLDGAHNQEGAERLAAYLRALPREASRTLVIGGSADKDIRAIAAVLAPHVDRIYTSKCDHFRAAEPGDIATELVDVGVPVMPAGAIEDTLPMARQDGGLVIVTGSLFLVGAVRDLVGA